MSDKRIHSLKAEDRNDSLNSFSAAINSREQLTPRDNAHTYVLELNELKRKEAGEYNPHENIEIEHPTTFFETLIHLLKSSFGTGILAMPLAFSHSGWVLGIIGTAAIGLLCTYCMHMLVRTEYDLCKKKRVPSLTYPGTAEAALLEGPSFLVKVAPYSGTISNTFLLLYQLGSCCVYTVFIGQNISNVVSNYYDIDERLIMLTTLLPLILISFVKNLKFLAPLTTVANCITAVSFGIIYYYIFKHDFDFHERNSIGKVSNFPLFFGTVLFALESIGMILPLQNEMKNPVKFITPFGVLNIGMVCVTTLYITTGLFGYIAYGDSVDGSISYSIDKKEMAISNTFLLLYQLGTCCVYTVFVAENIHFVCKSYLESPIDERLIMLMILLPLIFINYIRNLKYLAPLTTIANFITLVSFAIIFYYIALEGITFQDRLPVGNYKDYPLYFGTVLFALESVGVIMPLKNEMKNPRRFGSPCGVLNIGMTSVVTLYILTGFFGYLAYGADSGASISYTVGKGQIAGHVCRLMLAFAIFTTHALSMYVAVDIVWTQNLMKKFEKNNHQLFWEYAIRTCLVVLTFCLAVAVPYLDLFISLVGAFCISSLGVAFPAIMDSCNRWNEPSSFKTVLHHIKNVGIILFALLGLVVGTATSIEKIVEKFTNSA